MSENVREVLEAAFAVIHPRPSEDWKTWDNARVDQQRPEDQAAFTLWNDWRMKTRLRFTRFLDVEAYTEAAFMLVPEGWSWSIGELRGIGEYRAFLNDHNTPDGKAVRHVFKDNKHHPALAITQAALAAKGTGDAD